MTGGGQTRRRRISRASWSVIRKSGYRFSEKIVLKYNNLERDDFSSNRQLALFFLSMIIFSLPRGYSIWQKKRRARRAALRLRFRRLWGHALIKRGGDFRGDDRPVHDISYAGAQQSIRT